MITPLRDTVCVVVFNFHFNSAEPVNNLEEMRKEKKTRKASRHLNEWRKNNFMGNITSNKLMNYSIESALQIRTVEMARLSIQFKLSTFTDHTVRHAKKVAKGERERESKKRSPKKERKAN